MSSHLASHNVSPQSVEQQLLLHTRDLNKTALDSAGQAVSPFTVLYRLARWACFRDGEDVDHLVRVSVVASMLARELGLGAEESQRIARAAALHDLGKLCVPENLLQKDGPLTPQERRAIEKHSELGGLLLSGTGCPVIELASDVAWSHHENFDGSGYPRSLSGEEISLAARIVRLADCYDALRSRRVYKEAFGEELAFEILTQGDGRTMPEFFDPEVLGAFIDCRETIQSTYEGTLGGVCIS